MFFSWIRLISACDTVVPDGVCVAVVGTNVVAVLLAPIKLDKEMRIFEKNFEKLNC